jgi:hypothetical protein
MLVIWILLLRAGNWIVPVDAGGDLTANYHRTTSIANQSFFYGLLLAVAISGFQLVRDLRRLLRGASINGTTAPVA